MPCNLCRRKRSFQPWQNEHNSIMEGREEGKNNKQINLTWKFRWKPARTQASFKRTINRRPEVNIFRFQSASFVYLKVNESHPMHRAVIFRMKGKCTLLKSALSWQVLLNSKFETWSSILDHRDSRLDPRDSRLNPVKFGEPRIESRVSRIKTRLTVNLLLSSTVTPSNSMVLNRFPKWVTFDTEIKPSKYPVKKRKIVAKEK